MVLHQANTARSLTKLPAVFYFNIIPAPADDSQPAPPLQSSEEAQTDNSSQSEPLLQPDICEPLANADSSSFSQLKLKLNTGKKSDKSTNTLTWKKNKNADRYVVYGAEEGHDLAELASLDSSKSKWPLQNNHFNR